MTTRSQSSFAGRQLESGIATVKVTATVMATLTLEVAVIVVIVTVKFQGRPYMEGVQHAISSSSSIFSKTLSSCYFLQM